MTYHIIRTAAELDSCDSDDVLVTWGAHRAQPVEPANASPAHFGGHR